MSTAIRVSMMSRFLACGLKYPDRNEQERQPSEQGRGRREGFRVDVNWRKDVMSRKLIVAIALILMGMFLGACGEAVGVDGMITDIPVDEEVPDNPVDGEIPDLPGDGGTNSLMLSWTAPTTNEDGSPLEDLAGFRLYYGNESGDYLYVTDVGNYTTVEIDDLSDDTWYVTVTAYDVFGNESEYSNEINYTYN